MANKVQSGQSFTVDQKNIFANQAQLQVFEKDRLTFLKTGDSSDFLDWFLRNITINPSRLTGYAPYPTDFQHTAGVRNYYNGVERPVQFVENKAWGEVQASKLFPPTKYFAKLGERLLMMSYAHFVWRIKILFIIVIGRFL